MSIKLPGLPPERCEEQRLLDHCGQFAPLASRNTRMTRYYTARNWIRLLASLASQNPHGYPHAHAGRFVGHDDILPPVGNRR